jgi:hypothetical protein
MFHVAKFGNLRLHIAHVNFSFLGVVICVVGCYLCCWLLFVLFLVVICVVLCSVRV